MGYEEEASDTTSDPNEAFMLGRRLNHQRKIHDWMQLRRRLNENYHHDHHDDHDHLHDLGKIECAQHQSYSPNYSRLRQRYTRVHRGRGDCDESHHATKWTGVSEMRSPTVCEPGEPASPSAAALVD
jgi:hypothetical protein